MKRLIWLLLTVSIIFILSACAKIIYIGRRIDPEIVLEKEHHNIIFINLFDYTSPANVKEKEAVSYRAGMMSLLDGLSSFSNDSSFSFFVADTLKKGIKNGLLTTLMPVDSVTSICNKNKVNMLLALDSMNIFFDWETIVDNNDDGSISRIKNFYLITRYYLSLYSFTGDLINRSELDQSSLYRSRPTLSGIITIKPSLARARGEVGNMAFQAGQDYVSKFYPQIIQDTKQLFSGKSFRESNSYVFAKDWKKAIELLEELIKNKDPVIADKARHNLEVVQEAAEASKR